MAIHTQLTVDDVQQVAAQKARPAAPQRSVSRTLTGLIALYRPRPAGFLVLFFYLTVMLLLYAGWQQRLQWPLTAESGVGYALGIAGGTLMLLLMLYPLRKHSRFMRKLGPVKYWFRTHMLFGILGPVLILFHCGFQLGSMNSNVALFSMLTVATSGLIGRYFYTKIHHGLYGRKATLDELQQHSQFLGKTLAEKLQATPWVLERIRNFESRIAKQSGSLIGSLWTFLSLGIRTWSLYLLFLVTPDAKTFSLGDEYTLNRKYKPRLNRHIGAHLASIRKVAGFHFYERFFAIWHVLHFPLFLMLIVSGIVHVIAVHMY